MSTKYIIRSKSKKAFLKTGTLTYTTRTLEAKRFDTIGAAYDTCSYINNFLGTIVFEVVPTEK